MEAEVDEGPMGLGTEYINKDREPEIKGTENIKRGGTVFRTHLEVEQVAGVGGATNPPGEDMNPTIDY